MNDTIDCVVIGASYGKGRRKGLFGALYVAIYNDENDTFEYLTRCGSGFSDDDLDHITRELEPYKIITKPNHVMCDEKVDIWVEPTMVIEIMGDELTKSEKAMAGHNGEYGYSLRFPIFQHIRDDKGITDITTAKEIQHLYNTQ